MQSLYVISIGVWLTLCCVLSIVLMLKNNNSGKALHVYQPGYRFTHIFVEVPSMLIELKKCANLLIALGVLDSDITFWPDDL